VANEPKKPDFMQNPQRYFRDRNAPTLLEMKAPPKNVTDGLKTTFDEKSLFPKFILDNEAKMKSEHKNLLSKLNNNN
jgi:hypothetical protein